MKLIDLDSTYRKWLISNAALDFDKDLNEKFIGLTHDESIFFAEISKAALAPPEVQNVDELVRFLELHERHELALSVKHAQDSANSSLGMAFSAKSRHCHDKGIQIMPTFPVPKVRSLLDCRRCNYVGAAHVNAALTILKLYGLQRATNLLQSAKIPDEVITRVLQSNGLVRPHESVSSISVWQPR